MFSPMIRSIVTGLDNSFVNGKSISYFRGIIDKFTQKEYLELLDDFKNNKRQTTRVSSYDTKLNEGYSKFELYKNNNYELNIIEWEKQAKGVIHNHSSNGCVIKLLQGSLLEDIFLCPENDTSKNLEPVKHIKRNILVPIHSFYESKSHSYYIEGYHQISNINNEKSYSLHLYSPPNFIPTIR